MEQYFQKTIPPSAQAGLEHEVTSYKKLFPDEKFIGLGEKTGPVRQAWKCLPELEYRHSLLQ